MENDPNADAAWRQLAETVSKVPANRRILVETWAVEYRLARAPAGKSWIVQTALEWLRRRETDPYPEVPITDDEDDDAASIVHWMRYSECVPPVYARFSEVFRFDTFEPDSMSDTEYSSKWRKEFGRALKQHIRYQQELTDLDKRNHTWLVEYHFAGAQYSDLAAKAVDKMNEESVKEVLSRLRTLLQLPARSKPGPRTKKG
jgi:hypothetical protein